MKNSHKDTRTAVERVCQSMTAAAQKAADLIGAVHPQQRQSATNLIHYLTLRREHLRLLQDELHRLGLSSLASSESHILRQAQAVLERLGAKIPAAALSPTDSGVGHALLRERTDALFGPKEHPSVPHLMVTFETELADNFEAVKHLLEAGMNVARINCAHDSPREWERMAANVRKASATTRLPCKIYFDLAGPKIRTALLGKGRKKGRLKLAEGDLIGLAETGAVVSKGEKIVGCTLPGIVQDLRTGDRVLFDDGLFEAVVEQPGKQIAFLRMTRISATKPRLRPEKGINFPDTALTVRSLTDFDKSVLPFAQAHGDLVGFSFVRSRADLAELQALMTANGSKKLPIVLKIETSEAVENLPSLLVQGMAEPVFGVMIARGDLAVEIGFERLSEIQEEILWVCEAAHVPVIWATQVLETLNKSGIATRSEVTDAARAVQAECVMLNKGKHLLAVLSTLRDILRRSGGHHAKKRYVFRPLKIAEHFFETAQPTT